MTFQTECNDCGEDLVVHSIKLRRGVPFRHTGLFSLSEIEGYDVNWDHCEVRCSGCGTDYGRVYQVEMEE